MNTPIDMPAHARRKAIIVATKTWLEIYDEEPEASALMTEADARFEAALIANEAMTSSDVIICIEDGIPADVLVSIDFEDGTQMDIYRNGFTMRGLP